MKSIDRQYLSAILIINESLLSCLLGKYVKHVPVQASSLWECDAFLCFMSLHTEYHWIFTVWYMFWIWDVNRNFHHDTISYRIFGSRYDMCRYHKVFHNAILIWYDTIQQPVIDVRLYHCPFNTITYVSTHKKQLKYDLTILSLKSSVENLIVSVVPDN